MPKIAYDRESRAFLRWLDLGLLPPHSELPEITHPHYYDGCLVAELRNFTRSKDPHVSRVLLRPPMASFYEDLDDITKDLDPTTAMAVEQRLLRAVTPRLDCRPDSKWTGGALGLSPTSCVNAYNIARRPKRKRVERMRHPSKKARVGAAALLAIVKCVEQQKQHMWKVDKTTKPSTEPTMSGMLDAALGETSDTAVKGPPAMLLNLHKDKGKGAFTVHKMPTNSATAKPWESLRSIRLILSDQQGRMMWEVANARRQAAVDRENHQMINAADMDLRKALDFMTQPGRQVYVLELMKSVSGPKVAVVVFRGFRGDKAKDMYMTSVNNEEHGHLFMDEYKKVARKEGYVCIQDRKASQLIAYHQRQRLIEQQQQQQKQRQAAHALSRHQSVRASSAATAQKIALGNVGGTPTAAQLLAAKTAQSEQHALQQSRDMQAQIQLQRQLARQRQQQSATQIPLAGQHHMQQVSSMHQPPRHPGAINPVAAAAARVAAQASLAAGRGSGLSRNVNPAELAIQQQQHQHHLMRQHLQIQRSQYQAIQRAKQQQLARQTQEKNAEVNASANRRNHTTGKGTGTLPPGAIPPGMLRATGGMMQSLPTGGIVTAGMMNPAAGMASATQLQQFQQLQRQQQLGQDPRRSMMATVGAGAAGNAGVSMYGRGTGAAGNALNAHLQTQALKAALGAGRGSGTEALTAAAVAAASQRKSQNGGESSSRTGTR